MTANVLKTIPVVIAWIVFAWRGIVAINQRRASPLKTGSISKKMIWLPTFLLLLAGTTWNDLYIRAVTVYVGEWFLYVPRVALGIAALTIYMYSNAYFQHLSDRYLASRRGWAIAAGILTVADFALLQWLGWHLFTDRLFAYERLAGVILKTYLLIVILRTALPYMRWCQAHEPGIIPRVRLSVMWWSSLFFGLWMSIDLAVLFLGLGTESSALAIPFVMLFLLTLTLGIFIPDRFYERYMVFFYHLGAFARIRCVEIVAYHELESVIGHEPFPISLHAALRSPEHATYKSVISILDSSKILGAQPEEMLAGSLGRRISRAYTPDSDYLALVNGLCEVGMEYLANLRFLRVLTHLFLAQLGKSMRLREAAIEP